jgi:hypothetical protein
MKNFFYMAAIACLALFTSCEKQGVDHTGDPTGKLYGRWVLDTKDVVTVNGTNEPVTDFTDYSDDRFFLGIGDFPVPFAAAKEGTLITFDIDDVDATLITYNAKLRQISFLETLYLIRKGHSMRLHGTYDVVELTDNKLTLRQEKTVTFGTLIDTKQTTTYSFHRLVERPQQ